MEKNVDKLFDEMIDSVMEVNNNYDNSSFDAWNIDENYEDNDIKSVDNDVEKVENYEKIKENQEEIPVENYNEETLEDDDFASLLNSSEEFNNNWEDNLDELELPKDNDKLILEDVVETLKNNSIDESNVDDEIEKKANISEKELLDILDQTEDSEQFFKKLEEIDYD